MGAAGSIAIDKDKYPAGLDEAGLKEALGDKFNQEKYLELKDEEGVSHASRQCSASRQPSPSTATDRMYVIDDVRSLTAFFSFALPCLPYLSLAHLFQFVSAEKLEGAAAADAAAVAAAAPAEAAPADAAPVLAGGDAAAAAAAVADVAQTVQVPFDGNQPAAIENAIAAAVAAGRTPLIVRRLSHFKATLAHTRTHHLHGHRRLRTRSIDPSRRTHC